MNADKRRKLEAAGWRFADTPEEMFDEMERGCATAQVIAYLICAFSGALMASIVWGLAWILIR